MDPIIVDVTYDSTSQPTLSVNKPNITVESQSNWVEWHPATPSALPAGSTLMVHFEQPFGVFSGVRGVNPHVVVAKGNSGTVGQFRYRLFLLLGADQQDQSQLIRSNFFTVDNQCSQPNLSPWLQIKYLPSASQNPMGDIDPLPLTLILHQGDPVFCKLLDVPADHIVALWFPDDSVIGPFTTYFITPEDGTGTQAMATGMFNSSTVGTTSYGIRIWNGDGKLVASKDPSIDGLGRPPDT